MTTVPNPLDELQSTLRALEDRRDRSAIRARALRADLTGTVDELRELDLSIAATRGLLALADAAKRNAAASSSDDATPTNTRPARTTSKKPAKKQSSRP